MISHVVAWATTPLPTWCLFAGMAVAFVIGFVVSRVLRSDVSVTVVDRD